MEHSSSHQTACCGQCACPQGPAAATIPFSSGINGISFMTDEAGQPRVVTFVGFGDAHQSSFYLSDGEWAGRVIPFRQDMYYPPAFVVPHDATLKSIHLLFSTSYYNLFPKGSTIRPFACLAICNEPALVYTILPETVTFSEPYDGGVEYPKHTLRRGALTGLDIPLAEGTLVGIILGVMADGSSGEQSCLLAASGSLFIEYPSRA